MGNTVEKLQDSSHQNASELDKLYEKVLNSPRVCKSCDSYSFLFEPEGECMTDHCKTKDKAFEDYVKAYKGYKEEN